MSVSHLFSLLAVMCVAVLLLCVVCRYVSLCVVCECGVSVL